MLAVRDATSWLIDLVDRARDKLVFYWFDVTGQKYPMWFLKMLDGKTIDFALSRDRITQLAYVSRSHRARNEFLDSLFNTRLVSQHIPFRFVPNNFPYFVENGISHFVLWIRPGYDVDSEDVNIRRTIGTYVVSRFSRPLDFCYFRNSSEHKSVPEMEHYHVFIRQFPSMWVIDMPLFDERNAMLS